MPEIKGVHNTFNPEYDHMIKEIQKDYRSMTTRKEIQAYRDGYDRIKWDIGKNLRKVESV